MRIRVGGLPRTIGDGWGTLDETPKEVLSVDSLRTENPYTGFIKYFLNSRCSFWYLRQINILLIHLVWGVQS